MILRNIFQKQEYLPDLRRVPWEGMEFDYLRLSIQRQLGNRFIAGLGNSKLNKSIMIADEFRIEHGNQISKLDQRLRYGDAGILIDLLSNPIVRFIISNESNLTYSGCCDLVISFISGHKLVLDQHKYAGFEEFWLIDHGEVHESDDLGGYRFSGGSSYEDFSTSIVYPASLYVDEVTISSSYGIDLHVSGGPANARRNPFVRLEYPFTIEAGSEVHVCGSYSVFRHLAKFLPDASDSEQCQFLIDDNQRLHVIQWNGNQLVSQQRSVNAYAWNVFERFSTSIGLPEDFDADKYSIPISSATVD